MQAKIVFRIILISIVVAAVIYGGVYAFMKLKSRETLYHADLFELVPTDNELLLYVRDPEKIPADFPQDLLPEQSCFDLALAFYKTYRNNINISGNNEIILSYEGNKGIIFYRTTAEKIKSWETSNLQTGNFLYSPQKETYKGTKISTYLTSDDRFFCFAYHQGAFIGSYSIRLLYKALGMYEAPSNLKTDPSFAASLKTAGDNAVFTCFFKKNHWFAFDVAVDKGLYWINGCLLPEYTSPDLYQTLSVPPGPGELSPEILPAHTAGVIFFNTDSTCMESRADRQITWCDSLLTQHVTGEMAVIYFTSVDTIQSYHNIRMIVLKDGNLFMKEWINRMIVKSFGMPEMPIYPENTEAGENPVYRLSSTATRLTDCMGCFSSKDSLQYITIYGTNLLLADSKESLEAYLKDVKSTNRVPGNRLYDFYEKYKNNEVGVSVMLDGDLMLAHPQLAGKLLPEYFLDKIKDKHVRFLLEFNKEEELVYYTGVVKNASQE